MNQNNARITEIEIANMRNNLNLLRSQLKAGRVDEAFFTKQIDKLDNLLLRVGEEQAQQSQSSKFEALYNVSRMLGSSLDLQVVLDQVMDAIIQLTGAERGFLMLRDDDGGLQVKAARNFDQQNLDSSDFKYSRTVCNIVIDSKKPILTTNASEDPRFAGQASIVAQSLRSIMATPLRARGQVIGVVYVDSRALAGLFRDSDLAALDALSSQAAIALDNALLFSETDQALSQRVEQLRQLRRVDMLLNETLDAEKAVQFTLEWACKLVGAERGHFSMLIGNPPTFDTLYSYGMSDDGTLSGTLIEHFPPIEVVMGMGRTLPVMSDDHTRAALIVPSLKDQEVRGIMVLERQNYPFNDEQADLAERIIARGAVAIENALLYERVQAANKAKSEFVGIVAHDLKSPMTGIKGYAELLIMLGGLQESQINYLKRISDTVTRMEILVQDLADISRIESGHFYMEVRRVRVADVVQAVQDGTMPQIRERNHTFVMDMPDTLPDLWVDYYRLLQVLINLVSNAYKYTPDGGTITLKIRPEGERVRFSVVDTGIGLTRDQIAKLGTKFWRADDNFTRSQPGTGLGFSITRSLVEQMGSHIDISSVPQQGSTFTFSIAVSTEE
jgi:signal transduction histidine kinase